MEQTIRRYWSDWDLARCGQLENGIYRSRWYPGLRPGMEWLRLSLAVSGPVFVRVYAADDPAPGSVYEMEPALERAASDLLLYGVKGLSLCFTVEPGDALVSYELTFPGLSIDSALPAVMQGEDTLRKLLGIYQSLYMDVNRELARFPERLSPRGPDPLPELHRWLGASSWMGLGLPEREMLAAAVELNRLRGTKKGLRLLVRLVTGQSCEIAEQFQWEEGIRSAQEREDCKRLYGGGQSGVTLLFPAGTPAEKLSVLKSVLDDFIPLGVPYTVVRREEAAAMDGHSYLDGGAEISDPPPAELDGPEDGEWILE
jgi:phage tail-like protein|nr:hypothetical protein [uncultured Oscillibacter sp.]